MLHMFDPRPLAFGGSSELRNSSDKKWQAKEKKYYSTKMERGSKSEKRRKKKSKENKKFKKMRPLQVSLIYNLSYANYESVA